VRTLNRGRVERGLARIGQDIVRKALGLFYICRAGLGDGVVDIGDFAVRDIALAIVFGCQDFPEPSARNQVRKVDRWIAAEDP